MIGSKCFQCHTKLHSRIPVNTYKLIMFQFDHISLLFCNRLCHFYQFTRFIRKKYRYREDTVSLDQSVLYN